MNGLARTRRKMAILVLGSTVGCANFGYQMKSFLGGEPASSRTPNSLTKYSEQPTAGYEIKRQYRRMTAARLEEEAKLGSGTGSLWVMEGQGSYLASENVVRIVGDIVNVKMEGAPLRQLNAKAAVITKLLRRIPADPLAQKTGDRPAGAGEAQGGTDEGKKTMTKVGKENAKIGEAPSGSGGGGEDPEAIAESGFEVDLVPTRIVERTMDGNYRIKGSQPFMIGKREYRVIVTGVARAQDLADVGIDSSKLLEAQFDIVSKKGM